jgi:DNA invertase Pin-like site-specific DNA recombinase
VLTLEEAGIEIHSYLNRSRITLSDESGEMSTLLQSLLASFERRRASDRTRDALRRRAEAGAATGGGGVWIPHRPQRRVLQPLRDQSG